MGLDLDGRDLADAVWLAQFMPPAIYTAPEPEVEPTPSPIQTVEAPSIPAAEPTTSLYIDDRPPSTPQDTAETPEPQDKPQGTPFPVPAAPALRTRLDLARSLRPLMRKVPSRNRYDLDEEATVTQIAETQLQLPVVRSQPERWLDLEFIVEDSKTTVIWERAIAELQHLMEYQGAFRTVRTWQLSVPDPNTAKPDDVRLFPRWRDRSPAMNQRPRNTRELRDMGGRRLLLLVTDCTSLLWRRGIIHYTLLDWATVQPVSIVQLFPERLWSRTALSDGHMVRLRAIAPGLPSALLDMDNAPVLSGASADDWDDDGQDPAQDDDQRLLTLPIVTLNPQSMLRWARVVAGMGDTPTPGRAFELSMIRQAAQDYDASREAIAQHPPRTARQRVALFRATASETAEKLAGYMAATPVSLPVIDLLRDVFVPEARQDHVAEVLLSGLLQRCDQVDDEVCRYRFFGDQETAGEGDRVRDLLLDGVPVQRTMEVLNRLTELIQDRAGNTLTSFEAFLAAFEESGTALGDRALPLAEVGLSVLRRLGGSYRAIAQRYETVLRPTPLSSDQKQPVQSEGITYEELEYEVAEFINFPPLQTITYTSKTIVDIQDRFDFITAMIEQQLRFLGIGQEWVIQEQAGVAWGYVEPLNDDSEQLIALNMIAIPGGTFTMGAPEGELESNDSERPQHEVTVPPFCMSQTPITQAQWRIVAGYDPIDRKLDPDPSRFKSDHRPVERVSWDDAQEFCRRLSLKKGQVYRLPSEAEWEYACRAGTTTPFHFGEMLTTDLANYNGNSNYGDEPKGVHHEETTDVGSFPGNPWGFYDMHGNVWEWCEDSWHNNYKGAPEDGSAWISKNEKHENKVSRGGSWNFKPWHCRSAYRNYIIPADRSYYGFRVVCHARGTP
nr:SAV_2336 N-terminal domain-related protein [Leptolyngbya sp. CCY15150]